jgi:hypothetical protein
VLNGYNWGAAPAAGVIAGVTSVSAFSALLKWGRLDGQRLSANTESQDDVNTAQDFNAPQDFKLQNYAQGHLEEQINQLLLSGHKSSRDSSYWVEIPKPSPK